METNPLEEILKKDVRYKNLEKRRKILSKRLNQWIRINKTLLLLLKSKGKLALPKDLQEHDDLSKMNFKIGTSLLMDQYNSLKEGITFESDELDGLPSTAIYKYIVRHESAAKEREESMDKAEGAQVRIKELLDSLGQS